METEQVGSNSHVIYLLPVLRVDLRLTVAQEHLRHIRREIADAQLNGGIQEADSRVEKERTLSKRIETLQQEAVAAKTELRAKDASAFALYQRFRQRNYPIESIIAQLIENNGNGACSNCRREIPRASFFKLKQGSIFHCENCSRFVLRPSDFAALLSKEDRAERENQKIRVEG